MDDSTAKAVVARARTAQAAWSQKSLAERLLPIRKLRHRIAEDGMKLAEAVRSCKRSSPLETLAAEVLPLADACAFLERQAARLLRPQKYGARGRPLWLTGVTAEVRREPLGVVLIIGPSNYPLLLAGTHLIQALLAGNAAVVKPGTGGQPVMDVLADMLVAAGVDRALVSILPETREAGQEAVEAGVDKVVLTGSATTGAAVLASLAPQLIPAAMELSGCDAAFIRADADLDLAARALAFGLRFNGSETCIAPRRVFVHEQVAQELEGRLQKAVLQLGDQPSRSPSAMLAARLIDEVQKQGGRIVIGGPLPDGAGVLPTVIADANPQMSLMQADIFAPVLSLVKHSGDDDALELALRCPYALGATIFGSSSGASALARRVRAGSVVINDMIVPTADSRLPFGGRGRSGFGVTRGADGLLEMTAIKVISHRRLPLYVHLDPHSDHELDLIQAYLKMVHGRTWSGRLHALGTLIGKGYRLWRAPRKA